MRNWTEFEIPVSRAKYLSERKTFGIKVVERNKTHFMRHTLFFCKFYGFRDKQRLLSRA
jgi:hypothetical protein